VAQIVSPGRRQHAGQQAAREQNQGLPHVRKSVDVMGWEKMLRWRRLVPRVGRGRQCGMAGCRIPVDLREFLRRELPDFFRD
jgi:hypothetical protein